MRLALPAADPAGGSRRLTGPSLLQDSPGAAVEVAFAPQEDHQVAIQAWQKRVTSAAQRLGWNAQTSVRLHRDGASLACTAPLDRLHTAVECVEMAVAGDLDRAQLTWLEERAEQETAPELLALQAYAAQHDLPFLWDDEVCSLGFGHQTRIWPRDALPDLQTLDPQAFRQPFPLLCVTGTNGKTTTARLLSRMVAEAGRIAGTTSTDGLEVGGVRVDPGDWTGPGGARRILRDPRVDMAVLELARGGFLRRGVPTDRADAAIVTNVSDDHLGEWGIDDIAAMAEAKLLIRKTLKPGGRLILPAASTPLVLAAKRLNVRESGRQLAWQCLDREHPMLHEARLLGEPMAYLADGWLCLEWQGTLEHVIPVTEVPLTFGGKAAHNVENALSALLAARLVLPRAAIEAGLRHFLPSVEDNPGRGNVFTWQGRTLLVDFAHNPDGLRHLADLVETVPAKRRLVLIGQAGDRSDDLMRGLVRSTLLCRPDRVLIKESLHYLRGRQPGEVPALLRKFLIEQDFPAEAIAVYEDELHAVDAALAWSEPGDLLVLLIHDDFAPVVELLRERGAVAGLLPIG